MLSKKQSRWLAAAVATVLVVAGCETTQVSDTAAGTAPPTSTTAAGLERLDTTTTVPLATSTTMVDPRVAFIQDSIAAMSLEDKAAQLMMVEFEGSDASEALALLDLFPLGGFLLKSANGNVVSSEQVRELTTRLQEASATPLFIAVDQEGGRIDRIRFDDIQRFPSARVFGTINDPKLTEAAAWATGVQLASLGINVDFAPVADVNVLGDDNPAIGDRAFGSDPAQVATMAVASLHGFDAAGVGAVVKHFPGHGNTAVDSHFGLPVVLTERDAWARTDLVPFAAAVEAGAPMVMVAHVAYPALDPDGLPASMSRPITYEQLRVGLGFTGVIITDDLANMAAVGAWEPGERALTALAAGSDLLLNPGDVMAAISAVVSAVGNGEMTERTIDASLIRILGLKFDLGLGEGEDLPLLDAVTVDTIAAVAARVATACEAAGLEC